MPSIHKILNLQAGGRGSRSSIRNRFTRDTRDKQKLKAAPNRDLTAGASVTNSVAALLFSPSQRSHLSQERLCHQPLQPLDEPHTPWQSKVLSNCAPSLSRESLRQVGSSILQDGGNSPRRLSRISLPEDTRSIRSSLPDGARTEWRWTDVRAEEKACGRMGPSIGSSRTYSGRFVEQAERGGALESKTGQEMVWGLSTPAKGVENSGARGSGLLNFACQVGPGAAESFRGLRRSLLSHVKLEGPRIGVFMGGICSTSVCKVSTAEVGACRKQDFAGHGGRSGVNNALLSQFFDYKNGIRSPAKVSPLRAAHDVSLASDGAASRSDHQSSESPSGQTLRFLSGACNMPHPEKVKTGGEDAFFICSDKHVFGVADGVGGWSDFGVDAGQYARELMSHAATVVRDDTTGWMDPVDVMEKAHSLTRCKGSSTACILALTDSSLEVANLGDSGFVVVRNNRTVFKSPSQQHQFNIPFQLEHGGSDPPRTAQLFSVPVREGDVIIAASDGLFDNVYETELITHVVQAGRGHLTPQVTAERIAKLAHSHAKDKNRQTPFATAAQDAGFRISGGKMDDITVIVAYVIRVK